MELEAFHNLYCSPADVDRGGAPSAVSWSPQTHLATSPICIQSNLLYNINIWSWSQSYDPPLIVLESSFLLVYCPCRLFVSSWCLDYLHNGYSFLALGLLCYHTSWNWGFLFGGHFSFQMNKHNKPRSFKALHVIQDPKGMDIVLWSRKHIMKMSTWMHMYIYTFISLLCHYRLRCANEARGIPLTCLSLISVWNVTDTFPFCLTLCGHIH